MTYNVFGGTLNLVLSVYQHILEMKRCVCGEWQAMMTTTTMSVGRSAMPTPRCYLS